METTPNGSTRRNVLRASAAGLAGVAATGAWATPSASAVAASPFQPRTAVTVGPDKAADFTTNGENDTEQINAAIQAAGDAGGGIVHISAGTYNITGTIDNNQPGVLVRGEVVTHYPKVTYLKAATSFTTFARLSVPMPTEDDPPEAGGFEDLYLDGEYEEGQWVEDGLVIGDPNPRFSPARKIKGPRIRNLRIEHFTGHGISGYTNSTYPSGSFDDAILEDVRIGWCRVGVKNDSTATMFFGGILGACNIGVAAPTSSSAHFYGTVWTTVPGDERWVDDDYPLPLEPWFTAVDIQTDRTVAAHTFTGCYFESSTHSILRRSVPPLPDNIHAYRLGGFTFTGCAMRNLSEGGHPSFDDIDDFPFPPNGYMMDLAEIGGNVALVNCWYDSNVLADKERASRTINVGPETKVTVLGAGNYGPSRELEFVGNSAGVSVYRGEAAAINTIAADVANPLTVNTPQSADGHAVALLSSAAAADKPLVIQGVGDQSNRLTEWQNAAGTPVAFVSNLGRMFAFAGTEGLPAVGNVDDTDTGMYFPDTDTVGWTVGGAQAMRLSAAELSVAGRPIVDVADPSDPQDAATKAYVDAQIQAALNGGGDGS